MDKFLKLHSSAPPRKKAKVAERIIAVSSLECPICGSMIRSDFMDLHFDTDHTPEFTLKANRMEVITAPPVSPWPTQPQTSLHDFWGGEDRGTPRFFYLMWPERKCGFSHQHPDFHPAFCKEFQWRGGRKIVICSNIASAEVTPWMEPRPTVFSNVSLLKSHLQKCVRRSKVKASLETALCLLRLDPTNFLRRLPIIMMEDVVMHSALPILVWLMAASGKDFKLHSSMVDWILGVVQALAENPIRDDPKKADTTYPLYSAPVQNLSQEHRDLICALHLRMAFGGMEQDVRMFKHYATSWVDRMTANTCGQYLEYTLPPVNYLTVADLTTEDFEMAAVDFHCSNIIADLIAFRERQGRPLAAHAGDLKLVIWNMSSRVSDKAFMPLCTVPAPHKRHQEFALIWEDIEKDMAVLQKSWLYRRK